MVLVPSAAFSQESQAPTADDYVCGLTGECPEDATSEDPAADPANPDEPRVSATRGFSLSRTTSTAPKATPPRPKQTATRPVQRPAARPAQPGRVDLRLAFGNGSAALSSAAQNQVRAFAEALRRPQVANVRVRIEGHTDSSGGRSVNMTLSQRRAQAVADYLVSQGIAANRLEVRGYGFDRPLPGKNATAPENRRVEAARIS